MYYGYIHEVYKCLYPKEKVVAARFYLEYHKCSINYEEYISTNCRSGRSSCVAVRWSGVCGGIDKLGEASPRIGQIKCFLLNEAKISLDNGQCINRIYLFAHLNWYEEHLRCHHFPPPIILCSTIYNEESCAIFMPVSRILSWSAVSSRQTVTFDYGSDYAIAAIPLKNTYTSYFIFTLDSTSFLLM